MRRKPMAVLLAVLLLSVFVVSGAAIGGVALPSAVTVVKVAFNKKLKKTIVVDGKGWTVYMFTADTVVRALAQGRTDSQVVASVSSAV